MKKEKKLPVKITETLAIQRFRKIIAKFGDPSVNAPVVWMLWSNGRNQNPALNLFSRLVVVCAPWRDRKKID